MPSPAADEVSMDVAQLSSGNLRDQLKTLIDDKKEQLALVGALGHRFLSQQVELEERIQQMDDSSIDDVNNEGLRVKLADLANTIKSWETEDQQTWAQALTIGSRVRPCNYRLVSQLSSNS
jgi:hypothetical protein